MRTVGLALALFAPALAGCSSSEDPRLAVPDDVALCREHLRAIHAGLALYARTLGRPPQASGVALLGDLLASGVWSDTPEHRALLTCPGPNAELAPPDTDLAKLDTLSDKSSAYAARDVRSFPFATYPAGGPDSVAVCACDNVEGSMNHPGLLNVLYSDGSIRTYVLAEMVERGQLAPGTTVVTVGPDSPIPDLRALTVD